MAYSFVEGLKKPGLFDSGAQYIHVSKEDHLTGEDLKTFIYPSKFIGLGQGGVNWSQEFAKDGTVLERAPFLVGSMDTGKSWLEGDKMWIKYQKSLSGVASCRTVFKNPKGTPQGKDEYVSFSDLYMSTFSRAQ